MVHLIYTARPGGHEGRKGEKTKTYQVAYWIKKNGTEYPEHMLVEASTAKEAAQVCKQRVKAETGRNAFRPIAKAQA